MYGGGSRWLAARAEQVRLPSGEGLLTDMRHMVLQPEIVTFTVAWLAAGNAGFSAVLTAAPGRPAQPVPVSVTGLMISVLNRAAISLQVSGIVRPVEPSGAGILALHAALII